MRIRKIAIVVLVVLIIAVLASGLVACQLKGSEKIEFFVDGILYYSQDIGDGSIIQPIKPYKSGYTFAGWYFDEDFVNHIDVSTMSSGKTPQYIKFYAKFVVGELQSMNTLIFLEPNNNQEVIVYNIERNNLNFPIVSRAGYKFLGWYIDYSMNEPLVSVSTLTQGKTIYARWEYILDSVVVSYQSNGGGYFAPQVMATGSNVAMPNQPQRENYEFIGWYRDKGYNTPWNFDTDRVMNSLVLYAKWEYSTHILRVVDYGQNIMEYELLHLDKLPRLNTPDRDGYIFIGYYLDENFSARYREDKEITKDMTVYAKWEKVATQYSVDYHLGGQRLYRGYVENGLAIQQPYKIVEDENISFFGWYHDSLFTDIFDFSQKIAENISLYARTMEVSQGFIFSQMANGEYQIVGYSGYDDRLVLPSIYKGKKVTVIAKQALESLRASSIYLSSNIRQLLEYSLANNSNLKELYISANLNSIDVTALYRDSGLTSFIIDGQNVMFDELDGVLYGDDFSVAVKYASALSASNLVLASNTRIVGDYAFEGSRYLREVTLPDGTISIGDSAFNGCGSLARISIPTTLTIIGESAFEGCILEELHLPNVMSEIGERAVAYLTTLKVLTLPSQCDIIGSGTFIGCKGLEKIRLSSAIGMVANDAFSNLNATIYIDSQTIPVKWSKQWSNNSSDKILLLDGIVSIDNQWIYQLVGGGLHLTKYNGRAKSLIIPKTVDGHKVVSMGELFYNDDYIQEVIIEAELTILPAYAFYDCISLGRVVLPITLTKIGGYAFFRAISLSQIIMYDNVIAIGEWAFSSCSALENIRLSDKLTAISANLFNNCMSLKSIQIPSLVRIIGKSAFAGCLAMTEVVFDEKLEYISDMAFYNANSLKKVELPDSVGGIGKGVFQFCQSLLSVKLSIKMTSIPEYTFANCYQLSEVIYVLGQVEELGVRSFSQCSSLSGLDFSGIKVISTAALENCLSINIITAEKLMIVGRDALLGCENLSAIFFGDGLVEIGENALGGCDNLRVIVIPNTLEEFPSFEFKSNLVIYIDGAMINFWQSNWQGGNKYYLHGQWNMIDSQPQPLKTLVENLHSN